jgi:hypothetical protein
MKERHNMTTGEIKKMLNETIQPEYLSQVELCILSLALHEILKNINGINIEKINPENYFNNPEIIQYMQFKKEIKDNTINLKEINKIKKQMDKNNTSIKGLIRKLALIDDDLIDMIKSEIDEIKKENAALELQLQELSSSYDNAVELKNDLDILLDRLDNFNKFIDYVEDVETKRDLIASVVEHIVWDCDAEKNLQINYIGSRNKAASGVVNRRLRFGIGSRCNPFQNATFQTNPTYINIPIKKLKNN